MEINIDSVATIGSTWIGAWWFGKWLCHVLGGSPTLEEIPDTITVVIKHEYPQEDGQ